MHVKRTLAPLLGLAAITAFGLGAGPVGAATFTYTLSGVTFNDGATGTGSFNLDPTTQTFSGFSILTTPGTSDGLLGSAYTPATATTFTQSNNFFRFTGTNPATTGDLVLLTQSAAASPGTYALVPGQVLGPSAFGGSGEFARVAASPGSTSARAITAGSLVVTGAAVGASSPEPSSWALLGFTGLGVAGLMWRARRRAA